MELLKTICSIPTAPFVEDRVIAFVKQFAKDRPRLKLASDEYGNLLLELPGRSRRLPRWVFTAHMDHPGFVADKMIDARTLRCFFRGGRAIGEPAERVWIGADREEQRDDKSASVVGPRQTPPPRRWWIPRR